MVYGEIQAIATHWIPSPPPTTPAGPADRPHGPAGAGPKSTRPLARPAGRPEAKARPPPVEGAGGGSEVGSVLAAAQEARRQGRHGGRHRGQNQKGRHRPHRAPVGFIVLIIGLAGAGWTWSYPPLDREGEAARQGRAGARACGNRRNYKKIPPGDSCTHLARHRGEMVDRAATATA